MDDGPRPSVDLGGDGDAHRNGPGWGRSFETRFHAPRQSSNYSAGTVVCMKVATAVTNDSTVGGDQGADHLGRAEVDSEDQLLANAPRPRPILR